MFGWNQNGKKDTGDSFIDFMIFNEVINGDRKKQTGKGQPPQRNWIDELEELDAMDNEDE